MDFEEDFKGLRVLVKKLSLMCPMRDALPGCPLQRLRELPLLKRAGAIDRMSEEELRRVLQHHGICIGTRS